MMSVLFQRESEDFWQAAPRDRPLWALVVALAVLAVFVAALCVLAVGARAADAHDWHLMTQAESGVVSLLSGLSKSQCEQMKSDLDPWQQNCDLVSQKSCSFPVSPGDIKMSKCFE